MSKNCHRCHVCGEPIRIVLDGEEWCDGCERYQRPRRHGWASDDNSRCVSAGEAELMEIERETGQPVPYEMCTSCGDVVARTVPAPFDVADRLLHVRFVCWRCAVVQMESLSQADAEYSQERREWAQPL